jgi:hypothetical protein
MEESGGYIYTLLSVHIFVQCKRSKTRQQQKTCDSVDSTTRQQQQHQPPPHGGNNMGDATAATTTKTGARGPGMFFFLR